LLPKALHLARAAPRVVQQSPEWKRAYQRRAGIEGTISQGVRTCGLRQARYRGQAKTELQEGCAAAAINIQRVAAWYAGIAPETTRRSHLLTLSG
jgi:transposase